MMIKLNYKLIKKLFLNAILHKLSIFKRVYKGFNYFIIMMQDENQMKQYKMKNKV